jgi:hypothetical protein
MAEDPMNLGEILYLPGSIVTQTELQTRRHSMQRRTMSN